jgi:hypothetical protein
MRRLLIAALSLALATSSAAAATTPTSATTASTAAHPLQTGFLDPGAYSSPNASNSVARMRSAGASMARLVLFWNTVASQKPDAPTDPNDPAYQWSAFDQQLITAARGGLTPVVDITSSPSWAHGAAVDLPGNWPSPTMLAQFARAAAKRYSGTFKPAGSSSPLPRVRFWEVWNEPNADSDLTPQRVDGEPATPAQYRLMVNAFAGAVKSMSTQNLVVAGTLGPFGHNAKDIQVIAPKTFMADLLCVSPEAPYDRTCSQRTRFDIWAHNPYSNGGPNWHAFSPNDVSVGDLPEMDALLIAAWQHHTIEAAQSPGFWVTEFSWDTNPPDPEGVPMALDERWVSEALYRMWSAGVSLVVWFQLQDAPLKTSPYQSGFFTAAGKAKPSLEAFRFPFVAFRTSTGVTIWGRAPSGRSTTVSVQQQVNGHWVRVDRLHANRYGIFQAQLPVPTTDTGPLRAQLASSGEASAAFSLTVPPGRKVTPFGCGGPIPCP